MRKKAELPS